MKHNNISPTAAKYLIFSLLLLLSPLISYASQLFHTIQIGSFIKMDPAEKQFDYVVQKLNEDELDNLRIEKIGKFYSVRLGKFNDLSSAEEFHQMIKSTLSNATVMEAYIKDERIKKRYAISSTPDSQKVIEESLSNPLSEIEKPQLVAEINKPGIDVPLEDKIAATAALLGKKDYDSALLIIKHEITAQPDNPDLYAWFGMVYLKMGQPLDALKHLNKAVELSPDVSDYHNGLGYSYLFLNKFDNAIDEFNKTIYLDPAHLDALTGLCIIYAKSGKTEKALNVYRQLKDLDQKIPGELLKLINTPT